MRAHQLNDAGVIVNTISVDTLDVLPGLIDADQVGGSIGDSIVDGALVLAAPAPVVVPRAVKRSQARVALIRAGKMAQVQAVLDAMPGEAGEEAREWFNHSEQFHRDFPLIAQLQPALDWTDADIDALFIAASAI